MERATSSYVNSFTLHLNRRVLYKELLALDPGLAGQYAIGVLTSFVFGLIAVHVVMKVVRQGRFEYFAYYCFAAGLVGLYLFA